MICRKCKIKLPDDFKFCPECGTSTAPKPKMKRRPKGSGCISLMTGNRTAPYRARKEGITLGYFGTWEEANHFLDSIQTKDTKAQSLTLDEIYNRYQKSPAYENLAERSKKNVDIAWSKLQPIKSRKMRELVTSDYQKLIDKANAGGTGRDGCAKVKSLVSNLCKEAMKDLIIDRDFGELLTLPKYIQTVERRNLTDEEIIKLFYAEDDRDARITLTMLYTATRIDELFSIKKTDVNIDEEYMVGGEKTEAGKNRIIPIRGEIFPYIEQFLSEPGEYLISSPRGKKMNPNNWRERSFYTLLERLGIQYKDANGNNVITPHRARHTYISESIAAGIKPEALMKIVGHASYKTSVEKYNKSAHIDFLKEEAKKGF